MSGAPPAFLLVTKEVVDVRRCKRGFFSSTSKHYFRISLYSGLKYTLSSAHEDLANVWVRYIFAAVLMRKSTSRCKEIVIDNTFDLFASSPGISYFSFDIDRQLGRGSFGLVYLVKHKESGQQYAMKALNKDSLVRHQHIKYAIRESSILRRASHPFIIRMKWSFQTPRSLYMILEYCPNGSLLDLLHQVTSLPEDTTQTYLAQLLLAIEHLHSLGIVYRDLKPENILFDAKWHLKLIDFGLSKDGIRDGQLTNSFCGSPAYLSPEMLNKRGVSKAADVYGLGCILYECLVGYPPFYSETISELFYRIRNETLKIPSNISQTAQDLILKLLSRDPQERPSLAEVKTHPFFSGVNWESLCL
jgi:serine/threonine protein kinase